MVRLRSADPLRYVTLMIYFVALLCFFFFFFFLFFSFSSLPSLFLNFVFAIGRKISFACGCCALLLLICAAVSLDTTYMGVRTIYWLRFKVRAKSKID